MSIDSAWAPFSVIASWAPRSRFEESRGNLRPCGGVFPAAPLKARQDINAFGGV